MFLFVQSVVSWDVPLELKDVQVQFDAWKQEYEVACCETREEYIYRLGVFAAVDSEIEAHNNEVTNWKMGHNAFSHMTLEEIEAKDGGVLNLREHPHCPLTHSAGDADSLPDSVDWRTVGAVTPVKNQGSCGSCWSFSSSGAMEGAYFLKNGKLPSPTGFSEQNLIDCVKGGGGCGGGRQDWAFQWIKDNGGLCTEEDYPYEAANGNCRNASCTVADGSDIADCVAVAPQDQLATEAALMDAVAKQPVAVVVSGAPFARFRSGVITSRCDSNVCHAVLIVGYGRDDSLDCDLPPAKGCPYWLVKDSYGVNSGDKGYVRVQRGGWPLQWGGMCGILVMPTYPVFGNDTSAMLV